MKSVRAKFICGSAIKNEDGGMSVSMSPVVSGSEENKSFNDHTPGGSLYLHIASEKPAQELFEAGKEYYLDITKAE
jgi:hypothetical protein